MKNNYYVNQIYFPIKGVYWVPGIGERLRAERLAQDLSLEQIEEYTKIRKFYIEALENDNYAALPDKVYIVGFLRSYCKVLKIDSQEIIEEFNLLWPSMEDVELETNIDKGRQVKNAPRINFNYNKLLRFGIIILAILILIIINQLWGKPIDPPPQDNIINQNEINEDNDPDNQENTPNTDPINDDINENTIYNGVTLEIRPIRGDCWIEVSIDGKPSFSKLIGKGEESLILEADERIDIRLGNIFGVDLILNGELVEDIESKSSVVQTTFLKPDNS